MEEVKIKCPRCGTVVYRKHFKGAPMRFCSPECRNRWHASVSAKKKRQEK